VKQTETDRMECLPGGRFALHFTGGRLAGLASGIELKDGPTRRRLVSNETIWCCPPGHELPLTMEARLGEGLLLQLTCERPAVGPGLLLTLSLTNQGPARVRVHRLFPLLYDASSSLSLSVPSGSRERRWSVYKQGYQSWSFAGSVPLTGADIHPRFFMTRPVGSDPSWPLPEPGHFQSEGMLMLGSPDGGPVLLAGYVDGRRMFGRFDLTAGTDTSPLQGLQAWCEADGLALDPGARLTAEPLLVCIAPEREALEGYARTTGHQMNARVPGRSPTVWCSWYTYYTKVTEQDVIEATIAQQTKQQSHPVDVIQLDDGYMRAVGDWYECNSRFPHGLGWLASQVRQAGYTPGIWLAPFIALRRSRLFQEHRDWFVKGMDGVPVAVAFSLDWGDRYYALDLTHPEVQEWVAKLIRHMVTLGFGYLKLDFLFAAAIDGFRYDPQQTRVQALRKGLEIIREAAGEQTFLLGCGVPLLPAVGLVDAMRIGPDTLASWSFHFKGLPILQHEPGVPSARNALRNTLTRQWMHGHLWLNDPDTQILREQKTRLTPDEVKTLLLAGTMTGGLFSFSDSAEKLSEERLDWLRRTIPPPPPPVQPIRLLGEEVPFLSVAHHGPWTILLAVNAGEQPRPLQVRFQSLGLDPQRSHHLYDLWSGEYLGAWAGECDAGPVPPHGSRLLSLRPDTGEVQVIGSSFHVSPAQVIAAEEREAGALVLRLGEGARGHGQITLAVPPPHQAGRAQVEGANLLGQKSTPTHCMILDLMAAPGAIIRIGYR